jgi:GAF domain-containing protein
MVRTQVYLTEEQARDIKLRAQRENKHEAEVIRELLDRGFNALQSTIRETTGDALLRLAKLGEKLQVKAPADLSSRIDDYLYGDK